MSLPPQTAAWSRPHSWPLTVLLCGLPLWWVLGLFSFMPLLLSVPMAWQLAKLPTVHLPRGFGWWLLFLAWVVLGAGVLWAAAPGAVPDGGLGRLMVFGYRLWWYGACTVVMLWIANLSRDVLPDRRVLQLSAGVFVVTALGGVLGVLRPELEFRSLVELLLPGGLRQNEFIASMVHPEVADVQSVLDREEPRPKAPFPFTNSWGSGLSLSLVFFVAAIRGAGRTARVGAAAVACMAVVPVLYSLNRGLWASLLVGLLMLGALLATRRRPGVLAAMSAAAVVALVIGMASPLGGLVQERLQHQHSNERRTQLLESTVRSVSTGSPVVGFGSTRDVQGSFASIAGAATPECPACGVPPLGTQGQLWLILFSQGWLGLAFFLTFVLLALGRCWRCRTTNQTVCTFALVFFLLQLPVYDSLGLSLFLVTIALGLMFREERLRALSAGARASARGTAANLAARLRAGLPASCLLVVGGAALGMLVTAVIPPSYERSVWIELTPAPVALERDLADAATARQVSSRTREITLDTESALLRSPEAMTVAARSVGRSVNSLDGATKVGAVPHSWVLTVSVAGSSRAEAARASDAVARAYLDTRAAWLGQRRARLTTGLEHELSDLIASGPTGRRTRHYLTGVIAELTSADASAGSVVRTAPPEPAPSPRPVAVTSGMALGLLAACARINRRKRV